MSYWMNSTVRAAAATVKPAHEKKNMAYVCLIHAERKRENRSIEVGIYCCISKIQTHTGDIFVNVLVKWLCAWSANVRVSSKSDYDNDGYSSNNDKKKISSWTSNNNKKKLWKKQVKRWHGKGNKRTNERKNTTQNKHASREKSTVSCVLFFAGIFNFFFFATLCV